MVKSTAQRTVLYALFGEIFKSDLKLCAVGFSNKVSCASKNIPKPYIKTKGNDEKKIALSTDCDMTNL